MPRADLHRQNEQAKNRGTLGKKNTAVNSKSCEKNSCNAVSQHPRGSVYIENHGRMQYITNEKTQPAVTYINNKQRHLQAYMVKQTVCQKSGGRKKQKCIVGGKISTCTEDTTVMRENYLEWFGV